MSTAAHNEHSAHQPDQQSTKSRTQKFLASLPSATSSSMIVALLIGLTLFGHRTNWKMPRLATLLGQAEAAPDDWCKQHNVPESECIECNKHLVPSIKNHGWCLKHGVAQCPWEHPEIAQLKVSPTISPARLQRIKAALATRPRLENNATCTNYQKRIQFASQAAIEKAGIDIAVVQERPIVEAIEANAEAIYDQTRMAHLSSRVAGTAWRIEGQLGASVNKGTLLALIEAPEVGRAKSEFLQALASYRLKQLQLDRLKPLLDRGGVPARTVLDAESAAQEARLRLQSAQQSLVNLSLPVLVDDFATLEIDDAAKRLQFLGIPQNLIDSLDPATTSSSLFPLLAPLSGTIVERNLVEGEVVDTTRILFHVADVDQLWLMLNVRQDDAGFLRQNQSVLFQPNNSPDELELRGLIDWISTAIDEKTRTIKVRAHLPKVRDRLRANTFGTARIVLRDEPTAIVIPEEALHWDGWCHIVFVRDKNYFQPGSPKFFHIRTVRPGTKDSGQVEILAGLLPGEVIASKNSVVLAAQLLKANLGSGCCEACMAHKK